MGRTRVALAEWLVQHGQLVLPELHMLWVTGFPLFERADPVDTDVGSIPDGRQWASVHHPFTAPVDEHVHLLESGQFENVTGQHYDLVCNGVEVGGGSVRIHSPSQQRFVLRHVLGMSETAVEASFGHLLSSLKWMPAYAGLRLVSID